MLTIATTPEMLHVSRRKERDAVGRGEHDYNNVSKCRTHIFSPEFMVFPCLTDFLIFYFHHFVTATSTSSLADPYHV